MSLAERRFSFDPDLPASFLDSVEGREENPEWILLQIYKEKGFNIKSVLAAHQDPNVLTKLYDIFCEDPVQKAALDLRLSIIYELPEVKLLKLAVDPVRYGGLEILEKVVEGDLQSSEVQDNIPGVQHINLDQDDRQQILAFAYHQQYLWDEDSIRHVKNEPTRIRHAGEWIGDEEATKAVISKFLEPTLNEMQEKRDRFGVTPISLGKIREILEYQIDRTEKFLTQT